MVSKCGAAEDSVREEVETRASSEGRRVDRVRWMLQDEDAQRWSDVTGMSMSRGPARRATISSQVGRLSSSLAVDDDQSWSRAISKQSELDVSWAE